MGMFRHLAVAVAVSAALAACSSEAATPPAASHSASAAPSTPSVSPSPARPVMPDAAKAHTEDGAKAFVLYYVDAISYAEATLDTKPVESASLPSCVGCKGGIQSIRKIARQRGHIEGAAESADALTTTPVDKYGVTTVFFDLVNAPQKVVTPGKQSVIHPGGRAPMLMTLVSQPDGGWLASEFKDRP